MRLVANHCKCFHFQAVSAMQDLSYLWGKKKAKHPQNHTPDQKPSEKFATCARRLFPAQKDT